MREIGMQQRSLPFAEVTQHGRQHEGKKVGVSARDIYRIVGPYFSVRTVEQIKAVVPLAIYLGLFQVFVLHQELADAGIVSAGLTAVIIGLMLFMEGLKVGLMPFGETIGSELPKKSKLPVVLGVVFLLGIGVTFAEPAIGALQAAGALVSVEKAPYLKALLTTWALPLVLIVGVGVGIAAVLGTMRFVRGWSLKPMIYMTLIPTVCLSIYISFQPNLRSILGLAWDCGAVTTGPVTVPLVLALGIGIANAVGKGRSSLSGFGIVTLASLFPILGVQLLGLYVQATVPVETILASAQAAAAAGSTAWHEQTPWVEIIGGVRAIVPLVLFLLVVLMVLLRSRVKDPMSIAYGISLCVIGMIVFNLGLTYGLAKLGAQAGSLVPAAFTNIDAAAGSPYYPKVVGLAIAIAFAWILGLGATLAEPALNALGQTVENLTNGTFPKSSLMNAVAWGVGAGIGVGVAKIIFSINLVYLLVPLYVLAMVLTFFSTEEFVNIAWDSAGVTTGPVTVPLVLAMGLGLGEAVNVIEGFGILSMASIGPILAVLSTGLWIKVRVALRDWRDAKEAS
ncbi:MAG: DUF1538 domain-containing protein [Myxococcota bacterium]|nr:DUF1538 domain-containing protein [Myxococcota bacterium]